MLPLGTGVEVSPWCFLMGSVTFLSPVSLATRSSHLTLRSGNALPVAMRKFVKNKILYTTLIKNRSELVNMCTKCCFNYILRAVGLIRLKVSCRWRHESCKQTWETPKNVRERARLLARCVIAKSMSWSVG